MLEIKNYSKAYPNGKVAVSDLTLTVEAGDIYGFIGHNGAGKTTTLRSIAGVLDFTDGEILVDGHSVKTDAMSAKQLMAYIPDNPELYEYLTGLQYLAFVADIYGVSKEKRVALTDKYASALEIKSNLSSLISSYSHGMKQKLAIISALIHSPKLFLLDEPFVGLDPTATHRLKEIMHGLCDEGCAVFFSTHILDTAEKLCNKIAIIKNGKLVASGDIEQVKGDNSLESVFLELNGDE